MRSDRTMLSVLMAGVLAVGLVGCTSGGDTQPSPSVSGGSAVSGSASPSASGSGSGSSSGSASGSPSASASASVQVPEAARANTPEGATEFAKFFIEAGSQAHVDWDTSVVEGFSATSCTTCAALVQGVRQMKAKGQHNQDRRYRYASSQVGAGTSPGLFVVDLLGEDQATRVIGADGSVVEELPATQTALRLNVRHTGSAFQVDQVSVIDR